MTKKEAEGYWRSVGTRNRFPGTFEQWWEQIEGVVDPSAERLLTGEREEYEMPRVDYPGDTERH